QTAEGAECVLLLLEQWRSGEAEIAGLWEDAVHLHRERAAATIAPGLATMALIDQDEDVGAIIAEIARLHRRIELVDDRGDQRRLVRYQLDQVRAGRGAY